MTPISIALLSFLMLALQIVLMQALGYAQGHHLAYGVISIALLGFGAGGSVLTLWRNYQHSALKRLYIPCLLLCATFTILLPFMATPLLSALEVDLLFSNRVQWLLLIALGGVMLLPFLFGAIAISIAFAVDAKHIGRMYAANLVGSALGAGATLGVLRLVLPETLLKLLPFFALAAAIPTRLRRRYLLMALLITAVAGFIPARLPRSPYKALSYALQLPEKISYGPMPHPLGRVHVVTSPMQRYAPDLSLHYTGEVPAPAHLFVDGDIAGHLLDTAAPGALILAETPRALPFVARDIGKALVMTPGGTPYLNLAAAHTRITTAIESHSLLVRLTRPYIDAAHVNLFEADPRLFLARARLPAQDLIVFPERGMFGGPTGLQALGEDTLMTVEAVHSAFALLAPDGHIAFNVWLDAPLRHAPRMVDIIGQALEAAGVENPEACVAALRGWGSLSLLAGRTPLDTETLTRIRQFADEKGFDVIWPPVGDERLHGDAENDIDAIMTALLSPNRNAFLASYRFDVRAPTDDRPFFNQFLRVSDSGTDLDILSVSERGITYLKALLLLLAIAMLILVLGPLLPLRASIRKAPFVLLFFSGTGAGFMFFEVALIQRMTLLWGNPITAAALVIATLLCGMGTGSWLSRNYRVTASRLLWLVCGVATIQAIILLLAGTATAYLLTTPSALRIGGGATLLFIVAIPTGMPFPMGIRLLAGHSPRHIPWACGIDSALAVIAAPVAALIAFQTGFSSLAFVTTAAYSVAAAGTAFACRR